MALFTSERHIGPSGHQHHLLGICCAFFWQGGARFWPLHSVKPQGARESLSVDGVRGGSRRCLKRNTQTSFFLKHGIVGQQVDFGSVASYQLATNVLADLVVGLCCGRPSRSAQEWRRTVPDRARATR